MKAAISIPDGNSAREVAQLRQWLTPAGRRPPWVLTTDAAPDDGSLGIGVGEICAVISATSALPEMIDRIREWFATRHDPGQVQITITITPGTAGHSDDTEPDERLA